MKKIKRYILLQVYPGLPKDWEVGMGLCASEYLGFYTSCDSKYVKHQIHFDVLKENPESFEEIIEKDYEILSFENFDKKSVYNGETFNLSENNTYINSSTLSHLTVTQSLGIEDCLYGDFKITKVKRLCDSEIFSVGDKVKQANVAHNNTFTITGFNLDVNNEHLLAIGNGRIRLEKIEKVKNPLFKSEDGFEIFEGDECYLVYTSSYKINKTVARKELLPIQSYQKFFSTLKPAEIYVLYNKPCISLNDVLKFQGILITDNDYKEIIDIEKLKEFIKTKI